LGIIQDDLRAVATNLAVVFQFHLPYPTKDRCKTSFIFATGPAFRCPPPPPVQVDKDGFNVGPEMEVFFFSKLRWIVPYFYDTLAILFLTLVSPLTTCFPLTMVVSGFGLCHRLQPDNASA
jgi:hypothetical protein